MEKKDYGQTLNLPVTDFPMRGNLPSREPEIVAKWEEMRIYDVVNDKNRGNESFILHDGPPYANGDIHLGHTLNKVLKDIIVKYKTQKGLFSPYVPGWDTHGLPIELKAIQMMGLNPHDDKVEFRRNCKEYALKYVDIQREQFKRLGVRGDWDHPYITLQPEFEAEQIGVFGEMAMKGYIYKGLKPVNWCHDCGTALAEAEIEYHNKHSYSIYVKFPVVDGNGILDNDDYVVIWTTTPWTLPANLAISVHPEYDYQLIKVNGEKLLMAKELVESVLKDTKIETGFEVLKEFKGKELEKVVCRHPFMDRDSLVILGQHVTLESGTGAVHTAPGHGIEDFEVGKQYGLEVLSPVNNSGEFTLEAGKYAGLKVDKANKIIVDDLVNSGFMLGFSTIEHSYPHCWRCGHPTIFRATEQWFASIEGFRKQALEEINKTKFIPSWGKDRIYNMVADRSDWCISRQRTWGVPIPIFYCKDCGKEVINEQTIKHIQDLFRENGSDIWFAKDAMELIPEGLKCEHCGSNEFSKETDIMDVWFDSGSSHRAVLTTREDLSWPADLYLEGSDQHRGWFNSSLNTSVATTGKAPYRAVLTHGFLVDEKGRKMSKSLGNGVDPLDVINQMGADILRLWVSSADYRSDVAVSPNIIKQAAEGYKKIRNTFRFLLGNVSDFDYAKNKVSKEDMLEIDRWAMNKLYNLTEKVSKAYEEYEFHVVYHSIHKFCTVDMSAFYLDIIKDRLYASKPDSIKRRSAQTVMYEICLALIKMLTPVLSFTMEEVYSHLSAENKEVSPQLIGWPELDKSFEDKELEEKWSKILKIREFVAKPLEEKRRAKEIGHSLNAEVILYADGELYDFIKNIEEDLAEIFIVSQASVKNLSELAGDSAYSSEDFENLKVVINKASGVKCERCWIYTDDVGSDPDHPEICARCAEELK
ncbi:MAG: isoleucine--tRNA ligase [Eubacteriales bacterium]|nr:isoleucine--tRNA ligase [Eubacteriales bacterium]NCC81838.1 isoleucine--tRNA ligase [Clostridia bacterium]